MVIEDFPEEDPRSRPDPDWSPPLPPVSAGNMSGEAIAARLAEEVVRLRPAYEHCRVARGRTTMGLSKLPISECSRRIGSWLPGETLPEAPGELRFIVDDLKAYYLEAAASDYGRPSSRQLGDWLWNGTHAGTALQILRDLCLASGKERLRYLALLIVPGARVRLAN